MNIEIVELDPADTYRLRRTVLRDGTSSDVVAFDGDDLPDTVHLGVRVDGALVSISTWMVREAPGHPNLRSVQLRGMATAPAHRGTGVSTVLLEAGIERCRSADFDVVWARARTAALGFYVRHGFQPIGDDYTDATTGLAHHDIVRFLD